MNKPRLTDGFTLLEMMFAMAIGSLVLLTVMTMIEHGHHSYRRVHDGSVLRVEGRAALIQIQDDVSSALAHSESGIEQATASYPIHQLSFFSLKPQQAQRKGDCVGDLCAISYGMKDLYLGGKWVRCLVRKVSQSADVYAALKGKNVSPLWEIDADSSGPIAFGVIAFEVTPEVKDASGGWIAWDAQHSLHPEVIRVRLVVVGERWMSRIKNSADWDALRGLANPDEVLKNQDVEVYQARVRYNLHEAL